MMSSLRPYQELAIDVVCRDKRKALIMAMGLGKTLVSLKCMDRLACPRYLIIAPRRVIDSSWRPEIDKWQAMLPILSRYPLIDLTGSIKQRHTAYCRYCSIPSSICFTTPDLVHAILPLAIETKHLRACWDGVIVDESSFFRSHKSRRTKALHSLMDTQNPPIRLMLTGTPAPKNIADYWGQIYLLDGGKLLGKNITAFRNAYMRLEHKYGRFVWLPQDDAHTRLLDKLKPICIRASDADLPPLAHTIWTQRITLPPSAREVYDQAIKASTLLDVERIKTHETQMLKAVQICQGSVYSKQGVKVIHTAKIQALKEMIADNEGENILLIYQFKFDLALFQKHFPHVRTLEKKAKEAIEDWNAGKIKLLALNSASGGFGLNLQHGGRLMIWYGLTWRLDHWQQTCARLVRQGQSKPVRICKLIARETLEEVMDKVLGVKGARQSDMMDALEQQKTEHGSG